jgi:tetratricopeptide (TPR) repeat protein
MYWINAARSEEFLGRESNAFTGYLEAAKILFREEDYIELAAILPVVERLNPEDPGVLGLKAKVAFGEERYDESESDLKQVLDSATEDSSIYYLYGLLLAMRGERREADRYLEKAAELEPDYYLYWFRLGENRHLLGLEAEDAIMRALELSGEDIWVLNLAGLIHLEHDRNEAAFEVLRRAYEQSDADEDSDKEEYEDIAINYSEALFRTGRLDQAYKILEDWEGTSRVLNQLGNLRSRDGDFEAACDVYERAARQEPEDRDITLNWAAACIEADRILQAEELLARILESGPDSGAYNLMGNAARIKGEYLRADAAFDEALRTDPKNLDAALNLVDVRILRGRFQDAKETIETYLSGVTHPRLESLKETIREKTELEIVCDVCGRSWIVERNPAEQPPLRLLGELPDESPAGKCPECGKVLCIGCAKETLEDGRFHCPDCHTPLKLASDQLRLIVSRYLP